MAFYLPHARPKRDYQNEMTISTHFKNFRMSSSFFLVGVKENGLKKGGIRLILDKVKMDSENKEIDDVNKQYKKIGCAA